MLGRALERAEYRYLLIWIDMNFSCTAALLLTVWAWQRGLWCCFRGNPLEECGEKKVLKNWRRQWKSCDKQRSGFCLFTTSVVEPKLLQMFTISYVNWQLSASGLELLSLQQLLKSGRDYVVVLTSAVLLLFCHKSHLRRFEVILTCYLTRSYLDVVRWPMDVVNKSEKINHPVNVSSS